MEYYLKHHGVKGMKWGIRHDKKGSIGNSIHRQAIRKEPQITKDIHNAVSKTSAKLYGLDHRLKTEDSINRKLKIGKGIKDAVRYTAISNENDFVNNYRSIKKNLARLGYKETRCKNNWDLYDKGIVKHKSVQCTFTDKEGYNFEIQFQTPSSQKVKDEKVPLYEEARNPKTSIQRRKQLEKQMEQLAESIKDPKNILSIKTY